MDLILIKSLFLIHLDFDEFRHFLESAILPIQDVSTSQSLLNKGPFIKDIINFMRFLAPPSFIITY